MKNKKFNVSDWLPSEQNPQAPGEKAASAAAGSANSDTGAEIERITARIEAFHTDITSSYHDWVKIGFGLAQELGEAGRSYFHRISRFYSKYSYVSCDKQFDHCLKGGNRGTTIKTFFYLAQQAGIDIGARGMELRARGLGHGAGTNDPEPSDPGHLLTTAEVTSSQLLTAEEGASPMFNTPHLPPEVYANLPEILRESCGLFTEGIEQDIFLMSAITVLSGCLPHIEGIYFNRALTAHLYLFITGPSASGKGTMIWSRYFAQSIHDHMRGESANAWEAYNMELQQYENLTKQQKQSEQKPVEPLRKMLFIPANSSSSAFTQTLAENDFSGIIFETEADTMANAAKQDWGDSSDLYRKAFSHEPTSMSRRKDKEHIEITDPHLAVCLSGTPKQVHHLMPEVENGLFSRFMYYAFQDNRAFINPFVSYQQVNYHQFFTRKGSIVFKLYEQLRKLSSPILFELTDEQALRFTLYFNQLLDKNKMLLSRDLDANTKRLGIITFRIAMVLTALRLLETEQVTENQLSDIATLICGDTDFETALTIATTLERHAVAVYQQMPKTGLKGLRLAFYEKLPAKFDRSGYLKVAAELGIPSKTAEKYIALFKDKLLDHRHNEYTKIVR